MVAKFFSSRPLSSGMDSMAGVVSRLIRAEPRITCYVSFWVSVTLAQEVAETSVMSFGIGGIPYPFV